MIGIITCMVMGTVSGCGQKGSKNTQFSQEKQSSEVESEDVQKEEIQPHIIIADDTEDFQSIEGCAVFWDSGNHTYTFYNEDRCKERVSPDSTFKIISALIGIHNHVVTSEDSKMGYSGIQYPVDTWNEDLSLKEAFQSSCIWYFRKIIDQVGKDNIQNELNRLKYGNCDISQWNGSGVNSFLELNGFWLESSLLISPLEQVEVLQRIIEGQSIYTESEIKILKDIMLLETNGSEKIYGKTGTGTKGTAWFVGFVEKKNANIYFAIYLNDDSADQISGDKAQKIAFDILSNM